MKLVRPVFSRATTGRLAAPRTLGVSHVPKMVSGHSMMNATCMSTGASRAPAWVEEMNAPLEKTDPELMDIIEREKQRQRTNLVLIASENFTSQSVFDALGSVLSNKYSEGYPGARYYGGNEYIDMAERLCQQRALEAFNLDPEKWGVNVQSLSGTPANFQVYTALLQPHERIMALDLPHGGHLSHGYQTDKKKISSVSIFFETFPYRLNEETGTIDYDKLEEYASLYRPKMIIAGASAYSRLIDYERIKQIADKHDAYLLSDMAHISGLVAGEAIPSPFEYSDVVTTTTHKSLRGPRGAMIFYRKGIRKTTKKGEEIPYDLENRINFSVFPGSQGGPHNHTIAALATALKQASSPSFKEYQQQVVRNAKQFAKTLSDKGYNLVSGGTNNHLLLVDLRSKDIDGARVEKICESIGLVVNKNTVPGDVSAMVPSGIRMGTPALTTRGLQEAEFEQVAHYFDEAVKLAKEIKSSLESKKVKDFKAHVDESPPAKLAELREQVQSFSVQFPAIGFSEDKMRYHD
eukprot:gb/GECG01011013.1/.p1 GENE.gb/GECG01011013.1/~~gb/GECG01011013.1/.p1  ORF type:complete len:521 (+),score=71.46 gb/GECG01011013.1/:1-1563(+)